MRVLMVGGAGYVGKIMGPTLLAEHDYRCFDLHKVDALNHRSLVGDVNDPAAASRVLEDTDAIVYLAMGAFTEKGKVDTDQSFKVNVQGHYRFLREGLAAGIRRFVYASSLSVYVNETISKYVDEGTAVDSWHPYGLSKRLGEQVCAAASQAYPEATIIALRMMRPRNEPDYEESMRQHEPGTCMDIGPNDLRRIFLAAIRCDRPGVHLVQATGDLEGRRYPNTRATELLGWRPEGK